MSDLQRKLQREKELNEALKLLNELIEDMPFEKAAIAWELTFQLEELIRGPV